MKDRCGNEIEVGCSVDVFLDGRYVANVVEVSDGGVLDSEGKMEPAKLLLMIPIPFRMHPGQVAEVYVVKPAQKQEEKKEVVN